MRRDLLEQMLNRVLGPNAHLKDMIDAAERMARNNGVDEQHIALATGQFWGRYFKLLEESYDAKQRAPKLGR